MIHADRNYLCQKGFGIFLKTGICVLPSDFYRLMLLEEEHADPEALTEILLETCKSITYSLGECDKLTLIRGPDFKGQGAKFQIFPNLC